MAPHHATSSRRTPQPASASTPPHAPQAVSIADGSDTDFDPTPIHSPAGPQYDDLPPSYDQAREEAVVDAQNGVTPLDASRLEAHRLTLNEGPNEPEVWEYRIRGEEVDNTYEHEPAPEYGSAPPHLAVTVPIQHVERSENIAAEQLGSRLAQQESDNRQISEMFNQVLEFTSFESAIDAKYLSLPRLIALPPIGSSSQQSLHEEPVQFSRAYVQILQTHSFHPEDFVDFLDGLNAFCNAFHAKATDLLPENGLSSASKNLVHEYLDRANERVFHPRALHISLRSLATLLNDLDISIDQGQRSGLIATILDGNSSVQQRAEALYPRIEKLDFNVKPPSPRILSIHEKCDRLCASRPIKGIARDHGRTTSPGTQPHEASDSADSDPPHSFPEPSEWRNGSQRSEGRENHSQGPHNFPASGPSGHYNPDPPAFEPPQPPSFGRAFHAPRPGQTRSANEWETLGRDMGNWGEACGKSMGKWGEEYGRSMGKWGEQLGRSVGAWGQDFGRNAGAWGQGVGRGWAGQAAPTGNGSYQPRTVSSTPPMSYGDLPPSYDQGASSQGYDVAPGDRKTNTEDPSKTVGIAHRREMEIGDDDDDDDDTSSLSSDTSDSDSSDSDSDSECHEDNLQARIDYIDTNAEAALEKGKKPVSEINHERTVAIQKAHFETATTQQRKNSHRAALRDIRQRGRALKQQHRQRKRELRATQMRDGKGKGKGKGKAKKSREWREAKREYKIKRKELRKEKIAARKEWREAKRERRQNRRDVRMSNEDIEGLETMVWIVIENFDT